MRICRKIAALGLCAVLLVSLISMVLQRMRPLCCNLTKTGNSKF